MKQQCISEGDLRAWLDRELEPAELETVATHLNECEACRALSDELSARATLVMSALAELPATQRRPRPASWRWAVPVAAMAACLLMALLMWPGKKHDVVPDATGGHPPQGNQHAVASTPSVVLPLRRRTVVPKVIPVAAAQPFVAQPFVAQPFVALDDEPIETGVVMRVSSESGGFKADVIVGPDGRAHAIRILTE